MAVKARNRKKQRRTEAFKNSVKIKCCFCKIKDTCSKRATKEKDEAMGIITYCSETPNKPTKSKKAK